MNRELTQFLSNQTQLKEVTLFNSLTRSVASALGTSAHSLRAVTCHVGPKSVDETAHEVVETIAITCPGLQEFTTIVNADDFHFSDVEGLLRCNCLRDVHISYCSQTSRLEQHHIQAMGSAWSGVESLRILANNIFQRPNTPISILTTIAQCMGLTLKVLGIEVCVDGEVPMSVSAQLVNLHSLIIGDSSRISPGDEEAVASYLAALCPHTAKISMKTRDLSGVSTRGQPLEGWNMVATLIRILRGGDIGFQQETTIGSA
ncbi:hypothetical protein FRB90_001982 [Tulasnella sp. 427]|nr:hypothetical protein FRB90_001982 [Tulasnella sp. 427]